MNKNKARKFILAGSVILTAELAVCAEEGKNLIENPGFEVTAPYTVPEKLKDLFIASESPEKWGPNPNNPSKLTVISDAEASHGGSNYIKIEQLDNKRNSAICYGLKFKVNSGEKYSLSVWVKGDGQLISMCYAYAKDRSIPSIGGDGFRKISSQEWKEQKIEFTIPSGVESVCPAFHMQGTVNLDDAKFCKVD